MTPRKKLRNAQNRLAVLRKLLDRGCSKQVLYNQISALEIELAAVFAERKERVDKPTASIPFISLSPGSSEHDIQAETA